MVKIGFPVLYFCPENYTETLVERLISCVQISIDLFVYPKQTFTANSIGLFCLRFGCVLLHWVLRVTKFGKLFVSDQMVCINKINNYKTVCDR